jgi:hypothetical protein
LGESELCSVKVSGATAMNLQKTHINILDNALLKDTTVKQLLTKLPEIFVICYFISGFLFKIHVTLFCNIYVHVAAYNIGVFKFFFVNPFRSTVAAAPTA